MKKQNISTGDKFGMWTILGEDVPYKDKYRRFVCVNPEGVKRSVRMCHLTSGASTGVIHNPKKTHGLSKTPIWYAWQNMKTRCRNSNRNTWARYGGRGIKYSESWEMFESFMQDMGPSFKEGMSLERIDNNDGYSKENCTWIDVSRQANNRNTTRWYFYNGKKLSMKELAKETGINYWTLRTRLDSGKTLEDAITR